MRTLLLVLVLGSLGTGVLAVNLQAPLMPDPLKTPGDVLTSDPARICVPAYTKTVRNVPQALKEQVYRQYGITSRQSGEYEVDHLISLELGGSNSVRNLWPESYKTTPLNAHVKDTLENRLHALACSGKITLEQAQQAIAQDWRAAYVKYLGPLPGEVPQPPVSPAVATPAPVVVPAFPVSPARPSEGANLPTAGQCPASAPIKGNDGSKGKIYHLPQGDPNYGRTHAEQCFSTPEAAQAAGYRSAGVASRVRSARPAAR